MHTNTEFFITGIDAVYDIPTDYPEGGSDWCFQITDLISNRTATICSMHESLEELPYSQFDGMPWCFA